MPPQRHRDFEPIQVSFFGYPTSLLDAFILCEAAMRGLIVKVPRRLTKEECQTHIKSGSVFIFEQRESGVKRWTDGLMWSPSRAAGEFLIYRQSQATAPDERVPGDWAIVDRLGLRGGGSPASARRNSSSIDKVFATPNGLVKRTLTVRINETVTYHIIAYYRIGDIEAGLILRPSEHPTFRHLEFCLSTSLLERNDLKRSILNVGRDPVTNRLYYLGEEARTSTTSRHEPTNPTSGALHPHRFVMQAFPPALNYAGSFSNHPPSPIASPSWSICNKKQGPALHLDIDTGAHRAIAAPLLSAVSTCSGCSSFDELPADGGLEESSPETPLEHTTHHSWPIFAPPGSAVSSDGGCELVQVEDVRIVSVPAQVVPIGTSASTTFATKYFHEDSQLPPARIESASDHLFAWGGDAQCDPHRYPPYGGELVPSKSSESLVARPLEAPHELSAPMTSFVVKRPLGYTQPEFQDTGVAGAVDRPHSYIHFPISPRMAFSTSDPFSTDYGPNFQGMPTGPPLFQSPFFSLSNVFSSIFSASGGESLEGLGGQAVQTGQAQS